MLNNIYVHVIRRINAEANAKSIIAFYPRYCSLCSRLTFKYHEILVLPITASYNCFPSRHRVAELYAYDEPMQLTCTYLQRSSRDARVILRYKMIYKDLRWMVSCTVCCITFD